MKQFVLAMVVLAACKSDAEKMCEDTGAPAKMRVSACGEACDSKGGEACKTQTDVALEACMKQGNADVCDWMCNYGKTGADLYCKHKETLGSGGAAPSPTP